MHSYLGAVLTVKFLFKNVYQKRHHASNILARFVASKSINCNCVKKRVGQKIFIRKQSKDVGTVCHFCKKKRLNR